MNGIAACAGRAREFSTSGSVASLGDLGMAIATTPIVTKSDALAALALILDHSDTDPALTVALLVKVKGYIETL